MDIRFSLCLWGECYLSAKSILKYFKTQIRNLYIQTQKALLWHLSVPSNFSSTEGSISTCSEETGDASRWTAVVHIPQTRQLSHSSDRLLGCCTFSAASSSSTSGDGNSNTSEDTGKVGALVWCWKDWTEAVCLHSLKGSLGQAVKFAH